MNPGRNDFCFCGSGKKYKKCCLNQEKLSITPHHHALHTMRSTEGKLVSTLMPLAQKIYGKAGLTLAWEEFFLWRIPPDLKKNWQLFEQAFIPWYLFNWKPDTSKKGLEYFDEAPIAENYATFHQHELDAYEQRFITENTLTHFSIYQVQHILPEKSIDLLDLLRGGKISVHEKLATRSLSTGTLIMARVITIGTESILMGLYPFLLTDFYSLSIENFREEYVENGYFEDEDLSVLNTEIRELFLNLLEDSFLKNHEPKCPEIPNRTLETKK